MILTNANIEAELHKLSPSKIVVAYLGRDWKKYIPFPEKIELIIVSPTAGTNKYAVFSLAENIGWEKILLLEKLHAKVYLGDGEAIVGSANLSKNGIDEQGLVELCKKISLEEDMNTVAQFIENTEASAREKPYNLDEKSKIKKLNSYDGEPNRLYPDESEECTLAEFRYYSDAQFYVSWWDGQGRDFNDKSLGEVRGGIVDNWLEVVKEDNMMKFQDSWVLIWKITEKNLPSQRDNLEWLYVHNIYDTFELESRFPKILVQWQGATVPKPPFKLDSAAQKALRFALLQENVMQFFVPTNGLEEESLTLSASSKGLKILLESAQAKLAELN